MGFLQPADLCRRPWGRLASSRRQPRPPLLDENCRRGRGFARLGWPGEERQDACTALHTPARRCAHRRGARLTRLPAAAPAVCPRRPRSILDGLKTLAWSHEGSPTFGGTTQGWKGLRGVCGVFTPEAGKGTVWGKASTHREPWAPQRLVRGGGAAFCLVYGGNL